MCIVYRIHWIKAPAAEQLWSLQVLRLPKRMNVHPGACLLRQEVSQKWPAGHYQTAKKGSEPPMSLGWMVFCTLLSFDPTEIFHTALADQSLVNRIHICEPGASLAHICRIQYETHDAGSRFVCDLVNLCLILVIMIERLEVMAHGT